MNRTTRRSLEVLERTFFMIDTSMSRSDMEGGGGQCDAKMGEEGGGEVGAVPPADEFAVHGQRSKLRERDGGLALQIVTILH